MGGIAPGARVADRYVVLEELGRGGMGVVYLARDERDRRDVALKVLREAPEGEAARRLQREARAANDLDPKGVAQVYDVGETPDRELYLVMEFVPGKTLRMLMRAGRIDRPRSLRILRAVATTLGEAHRAGLVHRDVKPDNVMVCDDERVVLLDFGIVKRLAGGEETANLSTQLTAEGSVMGTPAYLSPEQALGRIVGPETDQFALAVMAYELLSGKLPWTAKEVTTILAQVLAETPQPASSVDTRLNAGFDSVLSKALSKSASARFASVEELADALEAADRGEYVPFEVSETLAAPLSTFGAGGTTSARAPGRKRTPWLQAVSALVLVGVVGGLAVRARTGRAKVTASSVDLAVAALAGSEARLACPIFEVRGVTEVAVRLGAAGATVACSRAAWDLGGRHDRVLPPAALLDVPREPTPNFSDPYVASAQREHSVALAQARADAYLDGVATHEAESWHVELTVRTRDAREIVRGDGRDSLYLRALTKAMEGLWHPPSPLSRGPIDPSVARWTFFPDADFGLAAADLSLTFPPEACAYVRSHVAPGRPRFWFEKACEDESADASDPAPPALDESSPQALAATVAALCTWQTPIQSDEQRRLVTKLEELRAHEPSSVGRAALGYAEGLLSGSANDPERAQAAYLRVVQDDPLMSDAWKLASASTLATASISSVAAAWFPSDSTFLVKAKSYRGDELDERLRQARLAYVLEPGMETAMHLGRALAEAGRAEEVRAVAATRVESSALNQSLESYLLAFIDLHAAKLSHAIARLEAAGDIAMNDLVVSSAVAGLTTDVATRWAERFLSLPDDQVGMTVRGYNAPIALCMQARRALAKRCLDRISRLGHTAINWWGDGGEELLKGAQRYAIGDVRGAVALWRPLVAAPNPELVGILPTDAFERASQPDLAARLDAQKLPYTFIAGVSEAAPREAKRALAAGDKARAKDLAEKVVQAWEVADVEVPAVAEMRALLRKIQE